MDALILLTLAVCLLSLYSTIFMVAQLKKQEFTDKQVRWTRSIYLMLAITIIAAILTIWLIIFYFFKGL
ncbi:hypothetical protein [Alkalihalobacillus pseudalcaliphilus]|uniref:hypothetical protein n=1 Tax=Alkalihalobacillus pseudalcaliphilus TaxID=79884 RepID=UPI00064DD3E0|nr:hypothetical protein [Alkalihalobacillus pseudalcaliphilus]KMK75687.1 hypothetical protein AB990_10405 [Alkalihalobacillus pseudalcaliphilus]